MKGNQDIQKNSSLLRRQTLKEKLPVAVATQADREEQISADCFT